MAHSIQPGHSQPPRSVQRLPSLLAAVASHTVHPETPPRPRLESGERLIVPKTSRWTAALLGLGVAAIVATSAAAANHIRARELPVPQFVSGAPELKKAGDGADVRWHDPVATIYFDRSLVAFAPGAVDAVQAAFGTWLESDAHLPALSFDTTDNAHFGRTPNGRSEVSYGPINVPGHEHDLALTITFSDQATGEIVEADMIFNSNHSYGLLQTQNGQGGEAKDCEHRYDLQSVATHEAGHFFGLGEDYDEHLATMYYTTARCELHKRVLAGSDTTTMTGLYSSGSDPLEASLKKGCAVAGAVGAHASSGGLLALALLGLACARRRR